MLREIHRAVRVAVADVRSESENERKRILLRMRLKHRRIENYTVAHRYFHSPAHVWDRSCGCGSLLSQASIGSRAQAEHCKQNHSMHDLSSSHPTYPRRSAGHPFRAQSFEHTHGIASVKEFLRGETNVSEQKRLPAIYEGALAGAAATRFRILSRSTFLWFASSTSKRNPSNSTLSPGAGTLPETWLSNPAMVVTVSSASLPKFMPSNSSTSRMAMLPRMTSPPSASRTTSGAGAFPPFHLSPTISSTRSSTVAIPATEPCSSMITASGWPFCLISRSSSDPAFVSGIKSTGRTNSRTFRFGKS